MRVFVLTTGRSASTTFAKACRHSTNVSAAHESRDKLYGQARFDYPDQHIEVDCRLWFFAGTLAERFPDALYVHLVRDRDAVARSWLRRLLTHPPRYGGWSTPRKRMVNRLTSMWPGRSLMYSFAYSILPRRRPWPEEERLDVARFFVDTVNDNITHFLRDKPHFTMRVENAAEEFPAFWSWAGLEGDLDSALSEWHVMHNASRV